MKWILKDQEIVQIYGQDSWHHEAYIVGNQAGLLELKQAIERALANKEGVAHLSPTDGEGYQAYIILVGDEEEEKLHQLKLPYTGQSYNYEIEFNDPKLNTLHPGDLLTADKKDFE